MGANLDRYQIVKGWLALNDGTTLLAGAIPSAGLAVLFQVVFEVVERVFRRQPASAG